MICHKIFNIFNIRLESTMKTMKRTLSFVLAAVMMVSMIAGMQFTVGAANSSALDPVIIDLSSKAAASKLIKTHYAENNAADITGNFTYDAAEGAVSLGKTTGNTWAGNMKFTFGFNESNVIEGRPYMIVKYKTNIKATAGGTALVLNNYQGNNNQDSVALVNEVAYSGGEYVYTKPVNIKNDTLGLNNNNPRCHYTRFNDKNWHNVLALTTNQADAKFFIKEIAFFATAEEAAEYYIRRPLVIDMSSEASAKAHLLLSASADSVTGTYSFNASEKALALGYTATNSWAGTHLKLGFSLNAAHQGLIEGNKYMVVTYKTNLSNKGFTFINFQEPSVAANNITLTHNVMGSGGEYVRTDPVNINVLGTNQDHYTRLLNGGSGCLYVNGIANTNDFADKYFYIKEIAFFESPEAAYEYYGCEPLVIDMSSWDNSRGYLNTPSATTNQIGGNYKYDGQEQALSVLYNSYDYASKARVVFNLTGDGRRALFGNHFMVVTYKTNIAGKALTLVNNQAASGTNLIQLTPNVSFSADNYVRTEPINLNVLKDKNDHYNRLRNGLQDCLFINGINAEADFANKHLYIKEIAFFQSPEQAYEYYDIQPVVIDMSTRETAQEYLTLHDYNGNTDLDKLKGKYAFDSTEEALSLLYTHEKDWENTRLRFHVYMKDMGLVYGHKYMVVTYRTNLDGSQLVFGNFNATNVADYNLVLAPDMGVSNDQYVRTEPVCIYNSAIDPGKDHYSRLRGRMSTILYVKGVTTPEAFEDKYLYIKEIAFFTSPEQAAEYYAAIDAEQPEEKGRINTGMLMMLLLKAKAQAGGASDKQIDAFVIDLSDKMTVDEKIIVKTEDSWDFGKYELGEDGVNLGYSTAVGSNVEYNKLHVKFRVNFKSSNMLPESKKFMVVTYKTNIDTKAALKVNNMWAFTQPNFTLTLEDNVSKSNGEWKRTAPININNGNSGNSNHFTRFNNPQLGNLFYLDGDISEAYYADKYFTIKEIAFFDSEKDAKAYYKAK